MLVQIAKNLIMIFALTHYLNKSILIETNHVLINSRGKKTKKTYKIVLLL